MSKEQSKKAAKGKAKQQQSGLSPAPLGAMRRDADSFSNHFSMSSRQQLIATYEQFNEDEKQRRSDGLAGHGSNEIKLQRSRQAVSQLNWSQPRSQEEVLSAREAILNVLEPEIETRDQQLLKLVEELEQASLWAKENQEVRGSKEASLEGDEGRQFAASTLEDLDRNVRRPMDIDYEKHYLDGLIIQQKVLSKPVSTKGRPGQATLGHSSSVGMLDQRVMNKYQSLHHMRTMNTGGQSERNSAARILHRGFSSRQQLSQRQSNVSKRNQGDQEQVKSGLEAKLIQQFGILDAPSSVRQVTLHDRPTNQKPLKSSRANSKPKQIMLIQKNEPTTTLYQPGAISHPSRHSAMAPSTNPRARQSPSFQLKIPLRTFQRLDSQDYTAGGHTEINSSARIPEEQPGLIKAKSPLLIEAASPGLGVTPAFKQGGVDTGKDVTFQTLVDDGKAAKQAASQGHDRAGVQPNLESRVVSGTGQVISNPAQRDRLKDQPEVIEANVVQDNNTETTLVAGHDANEEQNARQEKKTAISDNPNGFQKIVEIDELMEISNTNFTKNMLNQQQQAMTYMNTPVQRMMAEVAHPVEPVSKGQTSVAHSRSPPSNLSLDQQNVQLLNIDSLQPDPTYKTAKTAVLSKMQKHRDNSNEKRLSKQTASKEISESNYQTMDEAKRVFLSKAKSKAGNSDLEGELSQNSPTRDRRHANAKPRIFGQKKQFAASNQISRSNLHMDGDKEASGTNTNAYRANKSPSSITDQHSPLRGVHNWAESQEGDAPEKQKEKVKVEAADPPRGRAIATKANETKQKDASGSPGPKAANKTSTKSSKSVHKSRKRDSNGRKTTHRVKDVGLTPQREPQNDDYDYGMKTDAFDGEQNHRTSSQSHTNYQATTTRIHVGNPFVNNISIQGASVELRSKKSTSQLTKNDDEEASKERQEERQLKPEESKEEMEKNKKQSLMRLNHQSYTHLQSLQKFVLERKNMQVAANSNSRGALVKSQFRAKEDTNQRSSGLLNTQSRSSLHTHVLTLVPLPRYSKIKDNVSKRTLLSPSPHAGSGDLQHDAEDKVKIINQPRARIRKRMKRQDGQHPQEYIVLNDDSHRRTRGSQQSLSVDQYLMTSTVGAKCSSAIKEESPSNQGRPERTPIKLGSKQPPVVYRVVPIKNSNIIASHHPHQPQPSPLTNQFARSITQHALIDNESVRSSLGATSFRATASQVMGDVPASVGILQSLAGLEHGSSQVSPRLDASSPIKVQGIQDPHNRNMYKIQFASRADGVSLMKQIRTRKFGIELNTEEYNDAANRNILAERQRARQRKMTKRGSISTTREDQDRMVRVLETGREWQEAGASEWGKASVESSVRYFQQLSPRGDGLDPVHHQSADAERGLLQNIKDIDEDGQKLLKNFSTQHLTHQMSKETELLANNMSNQNINEDLPKKPMAVAVAKPSIDQIFTMENSPTANHSQNRTARRAFKVSQAPNEEESDVKEKGNKKRLKLGKDKLQKSEILSPSPMNEGDTDLISMSVIKKTEADTNKHKSDLELNVGADSIVGRASLNSSEEFKFFDRKDSLLAQASNQHRNSIASVASALQSNSQHQYLHDSITNPKSSIQKLSSVKLGGDLASYKVSELTSKLMGIRSSLFSSDDPNGSLKTRFAIHEILNDRNKPEAIARLFRQKQALQEVENFRNNTIERQKEERKRELARLQQVIQRNKMKSQLEPAHEKLEDDVQGIDIEKFTKQQQIINKSFLKLNLLKKQEREIVREYKEKAKRDKLFEDLLQQASLRPDQQSPLSSGAGEGRLNASAVNMVSGQVSPSDPGSLSHYTWVPNRIDLAKVNYNFKKSSLNRMNRLNNSPNFEFATAGSAQRQLHRLATLSDETQQVILRNLEDRKSGAQRSSPFRSDQRSQSNMKNSSSNYFEGTQPYTQIKGGATTIEVEKIKEMHLQSFHADSNNSKFHYSPGTLIQNSPSYLKSYIQKTGFKMSPQLLVDHQSIKEALLNDKAKQRQSRLQTLENQGSSQELKGTDGHPTKSGGKTVFGMTRASQKSQLQPKYEPVQEQNRHDSGRGLHPIDKINQKQSHFERKRQTLQEHGIDRLVNVGTHSSSKHTTPNRTFIRFGATGKRITTDDQMINLHHEMMRNKAAKAGPRAAQDASENALKFASEEVAAPQTALKSELPQQLSELPQLITRPILQQMQTMNLDLQHSLEPESKSKSSVTRRNRINTTRQLQHFSNHQVDKPNFKVKVALKGKLDTELRVNSQALRSPNSVQRDLYEDAAPRQLQLNVQMQPSGNQKIKSTWRIKDQKFNIRQLSLPEIHTNTLQMTQHNDVSASFHQADGASRAHGDSQQRVTEVGGQLVSADSVVSLRSLKSSSKKSALPKQQAGEDLGHIYKGQYSMMNSDYGNALPGQPQLPPQQQVQTALPKQISMLDILKAEDQKSRRFLRLKSPRRGAVPADQGSPSSNAKFVNSHSQVVGPRAGLNHHSPPAYQQAGQATPHSAQPEVMRSGAPPTKYHRLSVHYFAPALPATAVPEHQAAPTRNLLEFRRNSAPEQI